MRVISFEEMDWVAAAANERNTCEKIAQPICEAVLSSAVCEVVVSNICKKK